jgi:hypothetical protein
MSYYKKEDLVDQLLVSNDNFMRQKHKELLDCCKDRYKDKTIPFEIANYDKWQKLSVEQKFILIQTYYRFRSNNLESLSIINSWLKNEDKVQVVAKGPVQNKKENNFRINLDFDEVDDEKEFFRNRLLDEDLEEEDFLNEDINDLANSMFTRYEEVANYKACNGTLQCNSIEDLENVAGLSVDEIDMLRSKVNSFNCKSDKQLIVSAWTKLLQADAALESTINMQEYKKLLSEERKYQARVDAKTLRNAAIVGMTTTGAAKYANTLRALGSEVLLVEVLNCSIL